MKLKKSKLNFNYRALLDNPKESKRALCFFILGGMILPSLLVFSLVFIALNKSRAKILYESEGKKYQR